MLLKNNTLFLLHFLIILELDRAVTLFKIAKADDDFGDDECNESQFECNNGKCIDIFDVCNGLKDCNDGKDEMEATCSEWANDVTCELKETVATRFQCEFNGIPEKCNKRIRAWVTVEVYCNVGYVPSNESLWIQKNKCLPSGEWLNSMSTCSFGCGNKNGLNLIPDNVKQVVSRQNFPWTAYFYENDGDLATLNEPFCLGVLITPFSVVTAVNCTRSSGKDLDKDNIFVGFGIAEDNSVRLKRFQYVRIKSIKRGVEYYEEDGRTYFPDTNDTFVLGSGGEETGRMKNRTNRFFGLKFALITLVNQVILNDVVQPICIDTSGTYDLDSSYVHNLMMVDDGIDGFKNWPIEDLFYEDCKTLTEHEFWEDLLEHDKIMKDELCIHFPGEREFNTSNRYDRWVNFGTGVTGSYGEKHYLFGILTRRLVLKPKNPSKKWQHTVLVFSNIQSSVQNTDTNETVNIIYESVKQANEIRQSVIPEGICVVPYSSGTKYSDEPCSNETCIELPTGNLKDGESVMFLNCQENYTLKGDISHKVCIEGKWEPDDISCVRTCQPLLQIPSVNTYCSFEGENVSCTKNVLAGTTATSVCTAGGFNKESISYSNICLHSGNWKDSPEVAEILCIELCGVVKVEKPLISYGEETNATFHPWNAGIYFEYKKENYVAICSGTLISKYAVLTAAHCVHDKTGEKYAARVLKVGLGKLYRKFNHSEDFEAQYLDINDVHVPNVYDGSVSSYVFDIAILELKGAANLNQFVVPACIDTSNKFKVTNSLEGSVVGWGYDGTGNEARLTKVLKQAFLPYIDRKQCLKIANETFNLNVKITKDKFCGFHVKDGEPAIRNGDNGSGFTFVFKQRHYLYGVVSIQPNNKIATFTNVTYIDHLEFINKVLNRILDKVERDKKPH